MKILFVIIGVICIICYLLWKKLKHKLIKVDYSFGLEEPKKARELLNAEKYEELENLVFSLNTDILTVTIDYLALTVNTEKFTNWEAKAVKKDLPLLSFGVHYLHKAWIARSHATANNVSEDQANLFFEYQELSWEKLTAVNENSPYFFECCTRLIRLSTGLSLQEEAQKFFEKCASINSTVLWPYIHYCECIEPKWIGENDKILSFPKNLPEVKIIQQVVNLKITLDSLTMEENYFGGSLHELNNYAKEIIVKVDNEINGAPITSPNKYIVYGYIYLIANHIGDSSIQNKYDKLINGYYTLYPFGINAAV
jgi:hypothetical protein